MKGKTIHLHRRRKVNSLFRCTPQQGIVALHPADARRMYDEVLSQILHSGNPGAIAGAAIQAGETLVHCSHPLLALKLMQAALKHLLHVDDELQRDYALNHYSPDRPDFQQWYLPWPSRVSEADARELAAKVDVLRDDISKHLGRTERSHQRYRIHRLYEHLFEEIYEW